jgi:PAS domain S-box-containing protein
LGREIAPGFEVLALQATDVGTAAERDWHLLRGDGTRVPVRLSITAIRDDRGRISGYLGIATDLTAQRRSEARDREFGARMQKIASQVPGMVFQFRQRADGTRCFPYVSDGIREIYGLSPEDVVNDSSAVYTRLHPDDVTRVGASITESAERLTPWQCEYRTQQPEGAVRWLLGHALPEREPDDAVVWHGFITDITERKRAEQSLEHNRMLLQSIVASVDLGVFVVDVLTEGDFRFVEVNQGYEKLTGIGADEIRGRRLHELVPVIPAEMAGALSGNFRRCVKSGGAIEYEEPFFVRGRLLWWLTRLTPLRDEAGHVHRIVGRSFDITERKSNEQRFQMLTERLRLATQAAQLGIWDLDVVQNRLAWDEQQLAIHGLSAEAFGGNYRAWRQRLHPDDIARVETDYNAAIENRAPFNTEYRIVRPDGEVRVVRASAHVQRNPAGRPVRVVGVNWDITGERRAQSGILQAKEEAERLNGELTHALQQAHSFAGEVEELNSQLKVALDRAQHLASDASAATVAKSEFLANMSHEIRTPLNAVIGMSGILLGTALTPDQREFAETIRSSGDSLLGLINNILDYSKIESGRLDLERRAFDLRECVESALNLLAARAASKNLNLLYRMEDGVPEQIMGDETRLRQVIVNLLSNAVKFTAQGEVLLAIHAVRAGDGGTDRLHFGVHDSGIGIPAERMDRLFKTFSQVDASTTRQYGGTGLGLAISQRIVGLMGGRISVESVAERGSVFQFEIFAEAAPSAVKPFAAGRVAAFDGRRLLIVDENATVGRVLCQQAVAWGLQPRATRDAAEALGWLEKGEMFDLALIDAAGPESPGIDFVRRMRRWRTPAQLPILLLTAPGHLQPPAELTIAACVNKPVKPAALFERAAEIFAGRVAPRAAVAVPDQTSLAGGHPLNILLAEDNPVNQRVAKLMLQRLGYRADVVANGVELLEAAERQAYDLVLTDVQMPVMDGVQAARELCARFPREERPRIVAITANASTSDRDLCLAAGMDDFITKPIRTEDLRSVLLATVPRTALAPVS